MARGPIEFKWYDAYCPEDHWYSLDNFELEKRIITTIGWVLMQDRDYMVVAATYDPDADHYTQVLAIPRGCIISSRDVSELVGPVDDSSVVNSGAELPTRHWNLP